MGFCIGGSFIWNLLRRAPDHIVAAVLAQPSGFRPEVPDLFYQNNSRGWGPALCRRRPDITMSMIDAFLTKMYRSNADFVFTVTRDFVRACHTSILVLPDDIAAHPYAVAMEAALLAPKAEVSLYPWQEPKDLIPLAVRHVRTFLQAHRPATVVRYGPRSPDRRRTSAAEGPERPSASLRLRCYRGAKCRASAAARWSIARRMVAFIMYTLITAVSSSRPFSPYRARTARNVSSCTCGASNSSRP